MKTLRPCKHLDYTEGKFGPDITLKTLPPPYADVRYWYRGPMWTDNGPDEQPNPANVQFCGAGRGRINGIFQCYNGEMHCYETADGPEAP